MAQVIGFIGLGIMGRPMAKNLLKAGYPLVVHNRSRAPVDELVRAGARASTSPREVAAQCEVLVTMLPNSPDVEQVALGKDGIIEGARRGLVYVDMSTISPIVSQKVGKALAASGVTMLDAPVSGGEKGAIDATLSIMVGGDKAVFDAVLPIFKAMGRTITHLGPLGFGGFTKLANQIIVAGNLTALAEALTLAKKAGLDRDLTLTALAGGLAGSKCLEQKRSNYLANAYTPGFKIDLHYKDLGLIMESARALGVPLPATAAVQELFSALRVKGRGGLDHSGVITLLEDLAGPSRGGPPSIALGPIPRAGLPRFRSVACARAISPRSATSWSRRSAISSSGSWARARARPSAARSTSIIAGSWSRGAASSPRRTARRSWARHSRSPGAASASSGRSPCSRTITIKRSGSSSSGRPKISSTRTRRRCTAA